MYMCRIEEGHKGLDSMFDRECAEVMARRGVRQLENGCYQLTRDIKTKAVSSHDVITISSECLVQPSIVRVNHEANEEFVKAVQCPTVVTL